MTILEVNSVNYGSTGKIMYSIADIAEKAGHIVYTTHGFTKRKNKRNRDFITSSIFPKLLHTYASRISGYNGVFSIFPTLILIHRIKSIRPDIIQCHNLHGWYLNIPIFFKFLKKYDGQVVWTLHDCWSFTGRCPYFSLMGCEGWKNGCTDCNFPASEYPESRANKSGKMWMMKKKWFTGLDNLTLVTPSVWLKDLVSNSFLKDYDCRVINNGIDLGIFRPVKSDFKKKYGIKNEKVVLGVADGWGRRKGLDVFIKLVKKLGSDYKIVLVGTDSAVDSLLPEEIISIHRTNDQNELAEIYASADVFVNPTREDNYPTVNMEALACGTPVISFDTGGCPEMLDDSCGVIIRNNDVEELTDSIRKVCENSKKMENSCISFSRRFSADDKFREYLELYDSLV